MNFNIAYHGAICSYFSVYPIFNIITQLSGEEVVQRASSVAMTRNNYERINTHMYFELYITCDVDVAYDLKLSIEHIKEMYTEHYQQFNSILAELSMLHNFGLIKGIRSERKYIECAYYHNFFRKLKHITASVYGWGVKITVPKTFIVLLELSDITGIESMQTALGIAWSEFMGRIKDYLSNDNIFQFDFIALPPKVVANVSIIEDTNICILQDQQKTKLCCFSDPGFTIPIVLREQLIEDYNVFSMKDDFATFAERLTRNNNDYKEYKKYLMQQIKALKENVNNRYAQDIEDVDAQIAEKEKRLRRLNATKSTH